MITAKIICSAKADQGEGDDRQVTVTFRPDYEDDRNKEWSRHTPALSLSMTLKGDVADRFNVDDRFTLTFEPSESDR
jgi:hypothetical protein